MSRFLSPITAINSAIELIESNNAIANNDRECFEIIRFQIKSINKLVNDILTLSEIEVAKTEEIKHFEKFNLNLAVEKIVSDFRIYLLKLILFKIHIPNASGMKNYFQRPCQIF